MKKSILVGILCAGLWAMMVSPMLRAQEVIPPGSLVMDLIKLFRGMASNPDALKNFDDFAKKYLDRARELKNKGQIDHAFFVRYLRLLGVVKIVSMDDEEGVLTQVTIDAINQFTLTDEKRELKENQKVGIGLMAASLAEEMIDLQGYLMNNLKPNPNVSRFIGPKAAPFEELKKDGGVYYHKDRSTPFTGIAVKKHKDGKTADRMVFQKGKMDGPRVLYDESGYKIAEGWMSNNAQSGLWLFYEDENRLKEIIDCNEQIRTFYNQFKENLKKGLPSEALKNLDAAIKIKPLETLTDAKEKFYLLQSKSFSELRKNDEAIKYMRKYAAQVKKNSRDSIERAGAFYRLGTLYYHRLRAKNLDDKAKLEAVNQGLAALQEALDNRPHHADSYSYMALLYRWSARLKPEQNARYMELARQSQQKSRQILNKLRSGCGIESDLESIGTEGIKADKKRNLPRNPYLVKPDDLRQLDIFDSLMLYLPPPPPPPPPAKRKKK